MRSKIVYQKIPRPMIDLNTMDSTLSTITSGKHLQLYSDNNVTGIYFLFEQDEQTDIKHSLLTFCGFTTTEMDISRIMDGTEFKNEVCKARCI